MSNFSGTSTFDVVRVTWYRLYLGDPVMGEHAHPKAFRDRQVNTARPRCDYRVESARGLTGGHTARRHQPVKERGASPAQRRKERAVGSDHQRPMAPVFSVQAGRCL